MLAGKRQEKDFICKNRRKTVRKTDFSSAVGAGDMLGGNEKLAMIDDYTWGIIE